jgi:SulP family sulfate permease
MTPDTLLGEEQPGAAPSPALRHLFAAVTAGLIGGLLTLSAAIAYPAVIFTGSMAVHLGIGITLALFTSMVLGAVVAWGSSYPAAIAQAQIETAVVLGAIAIVVAETAGSADAEVRLATLLVVIAVATVSLGLGFVLLGAFRLGNVIRYIPFPVIGGFLGYIAWLLAKGGIAIMLGRPLDLETGLALLQPELLLRWLPAALLALALLVLQLKRRHFLNLPVVLLLALTGFWLIAWLGGGTPATLLAGGHVLEPLAPEQRWSPLRLPMALAAVDWQVVLAALPQIAVVSVIATITLLLTASTLEVASRRPVDLNRELTVAGIGNLLAALGGGLPGYHSVSASLLPHYLGTRSRLVGLIGALMCAGTLVFGGPLLAYVPTLLIGLVLLYLAFDITAELILDRWPLIGAGEKAVMLVVLAALVGIGFVEGIVIGIVAGLAVFAINYARLGVVRAQGGGRAFASNVMRPPAQANRLEELADAVHVVRLQGYLFFGTAHRLLDQASTDLTKPRAIPLRFLVLDLGRVDGIDSSAIACLVRLVEQAESNGFEILLAAVPAPVARLLDAGGRSLALATFADLDHCLEHVENRLLGLAGGNAPERQALEDELARAFPEPERRRRLLAYTRPVRWQAGETIIEQGAPSDEMYFFDQGRIIANLVLPDGGEVRVRTILPGTVVGEVGCYLDVPRTLSLVAATAVEARAFDRAAIARLRAADPDLCADFHAWMARLIGERLAHLTGHLAAEITGEGRALGSPGR